MRIWACFSTWGCTGGARRATRVMVIEQCWISRRQLVTATQADLGRKRRGEPPHASGRPRRSPLRAATRHGAAPARRQQRQSRGRPPGRLRAQLPQPACASAAVRHRVDIESTCRSWPGNSAGAGFRRRRRCARWVAPLRRGQGTDEGTARRRTHFSLASRHRSRADLDISIFFVRELRISRANAVSVALNQTVPDQAFHFSLSRSARNCFLSCCGLDADREADLRLGPAEAPASPSGHARRPLDDFSPQMRYRFVKFPRTGRRNIP